ncbi:hypothetical protein J6590_079412 [Homalodisca vitripennis]|nr:hypothetical protein J6590_079412 [Homalodisca vitripennis]
MSGVYYFEEPECTTWPAQMNVSAQFELRPADIHCDRVLRVYQFVTSSSTRFISLLNEHYDQPTAHCDVLLLSAT